MVARGPDGDLRDLLAAEAIPPFVYCYPPRSSYVEQEAPPDIAALWAADLAHSDPDLNLYLHVPFCRYRCGFCNLYTVIGSGAEDRSRYAAALAADLIAHRAIIQRRRLRTFYIGGGTPTLLRLDDLALLTTALSQIYPNWRSVCEEVAIEASPDSLAGPEGATYARGLRELGLTRVNLGMQSLQPAELKEAGRALAGGRQIQDAVANIRAAGISNLSTDLIIGFRGQSDLSWDDSVERLIAIRPETISTYFLTIRPDSSYGRSLRYPTQRAPHLYRRYERARDAFLEAGYVQESNVRYKLPGRGGYRQKVLQFSGIPVLGLGAGARSYTNTSDYLVGGSHAPRPQQIADYVAGVRAGGPPITSGFRFDDEERIRKRLVLDLFDLDLADFAGRGSARFWEEVDLVLSAGEDEGLLSRVGPTRYQLTQRGFQYRDILSWTLFSKRVRERDFLFYGRIAEDGAQLRRPVAATPAIGAKLPA